MKKCKECGREEWGFLSVLNEDGYCPTCAIVHNEEKIKKLQEQLSEANRLIKECKDKIEWNKIILTSFPPQEKIGDYLYSKVNDYLEKWGIK